MHNEQLNKEKLTDFVKAFNININDYKPYEIAFLHPELKSSNHLSNTDQSYLFKENQRFEYLGDTIYNFCINLYLFELIVRDNKKLTDKQMNNTKEYFISGKFQAKLAKELKFRDFILLTNSNLKITDEIYEDIFESFIAAIYIDQGLEKVKQFINQIIFKNYPIIIDKKQCFSVEQKNIHANNLIVFEKSKLNEIITNYEKQPVQTLNDIYNYLKINNKKEKLIPIKQLITYKNKSNKTILMVNEVEFQSGKNKKEAIINTIRTNMELLIDTICKNMIS